MTYKPKTEAEYLKANPKGNYKNYLRKWLEIDAARSPKKREKKSD